MSGSGSSSYTHYEDVEKKAEQIVGVRIAQRAAPASHLVGDMQINSPVQAFAYVSLKTMAKGMTIYDKVRLAIERKMFLEDKSKNGGLEEEEKNEIDSGLFRIDVNIRQRIPEDGAVFMFAELMKEFADNAGDFSPSIKGTGRKQFFDVLKSQKTGLTPEEKQPGRLGRIFGRGSKQD